MFEGKMAAQALAMQQGSTAHAQHCLHKEWNGITYMPGDDFPA